MSDPNGQAAVPDTRTEVCNEIDRMMTSLWQRRSGVRPASVTTEYVGNVVRCEIQEGHPPSPADDGDAEDPIVSSIDTRGYQIEARRGVERFTHRTVLGFITKRSDDLPARDTFVLEAARIRH
jgi:hypothetical protein